MKLPSYLRNIEIPSMARFTGFKKQNREEKKNHYHSTSSTCSLLQYIVFSLNWAPAEHQLILKNIWVALDPPHPL